ncbi:SusC/RagA family TonB-linked outer membrane protein [Flavobacterium pectinovorum]|uniref:SusC/RagA family TonB-linked outer membrane protein n=1 Tax=Flavobacterium pectinovorum TaxID=29533 RepID=UPI00265F14CC|nr:SusC/RagA family TonB-linked outer membrane protein [Flavobacterium pectinovorum]WKL46173.1 SusC/RagA family TonB-linked outer membrane protein [Flavobacterium pectinovorum]
MKQALLKRCSFLLFALMSIVSYAQTSNTVTVTGTVTDNVSGLLPGVNVTEKSTKNSVTTDFNGSYSIKVKPNATLVFSFIGMKKQEVAIGTRTIVNAKLAEDSNELQNIVVVGYGTQKKEKLTGAIATISASDIQELPVSNLSDALRGLVPGMSVIDGGGRPGDQSTIEIRQTYGFSKDGSSKTPLIVIDDMIQVDPITGRASMEAFNRLDPSEIESMTVLKDASAAIYGSRAAQGAIVIKTKRGKSGVPSFNYFSQFAVNDAVSHSKTMSAYDYGVFSNRFFTGGNNIGTNGSNLFSPTELEEMKGLNYDWLEEAWKPAIQQKHTLSVTGGTEKATYFAGINYFTQGANLGEQDYNKWNFRTGMTAKITSSLDFSAAVSGNSGDIEKSFTKSSSGINDSSYASAAGGEQADYGFLLHMPKYIPWETVVDGKPYYMSPFARTDRTLGSANANNTIAGYNYFASINNGSKQISSDFSYNVNMSLNWKVPFIKGLSLKGTYSRTQSSESTEQVQLPYDLARIMGYEKLDSHLASAALPTTTNNGVDNYYSIETNTRSARVYYDSFNSKSVQANFFMDYNRTFDNHEIGAMFSVERSETEFNSTRLAFENTGKDYAGSYQTAGTLTTNSTALKGEQGTLSYLGRFNYSYKSRYMLQFLFRSDASTKFAPENYWGFFPSLQAGWIVSKENWFTDNVSWIDFLKVRYSIGKTGNDNINAWRWMKLYDVNADKGFQFGSNGGMLGGSVTPRVEPNRNVGWDTTIKNNLGLDLTLLKNRLSLTADFYYDKSKDMLTGMAGVVGVPISVGGGYAEENYAAVDSWGAEFSLGWKDKINQNFTYNVGVNFGYSDNEVKKFPEPALMHPSNNLTQAGQSTFFPQWGFKTWKGTSTGDGILRTDEDVANYWSYLTERATAAGGAPNYMGISSVSNMRRGMLAYEDAGGQFNDKDGTQAGPNGQIQKNEDFVKLVNSSRTYGFTTNLGGRYKSFFFKTQIATSWGGYRAIDVVKQGTSPTHNMWARETFWNDMYADDNLDGKYPNLANQEYIAIPSDFWQLDTFRCTVRNLTLGFDMPKDLLDKIKIAKWSVGVTGNNLWDLYNPYPDHYRNMYDSSSENYPTLRTWAVTLNITF